jgi:hypothetical protein
MMNVMIIMMLIIMTRLRRISIFGDHLDLAYLMTFVRGKPLVIYIWSTLEDW